MTFELATNHYNTFNSDYKHSLYMTWHDMWGRCYNQNRSSYINYGNRGIRVWEGFKDFKTFLEWMGNKPQIDYSLDRIDNNGHYIPDNLRWASKTTQAYNRDIREDNTSGYVGVNLDKSRWQARITVNKKRIYLGHFDCKHEAGLAYMRAKELYHK